MGVKLSFQSSFESLINVDTLIATDHPIRAIKRMCDELLGEMSELFDGIYAAASAPLIPPETLPKGKVLQVLCTMRSDRQLCARLHADLLFRLFVDRPLDITGFTASVYSKNEARLLKHAVAGLCFVEVVELARRHGWVSDDHFSVDGALIETWASLKGFLPRGRDGPDGGNVWMDFKVAPRRNDT